MRKRKILALLASALMLVSLGGCELGKNTTTIASYGDGQTVPAGVYLYYQITAYESGFYQVSDPQEDPMKQSIDGVSFSDWVTQKAQEAVKRQIATELEFQRLGLSLTEEETDAALSGVNSAWEANGAVYEKNGISKSSIELVALSSAKYSKLFYAYYGEGGEKEVSEDELLDYYQTNYKRVAQIIFPKTNSDGSALDEAGLEQLDERVGRYMELAESGEPFHKLIQMKDEEDAAASGEEPVSHEWHEDDENYHDIIVSKDSSGYYPQAFLDAVFASDELNVPAVYESSGYKAVFIRKDLMADPDDFTNGKETLLSNLKSAEYESELLGAADQDGIVWNDAAVKRYQPKNLKFR